MAYFGDELNAEKQDRPMIYVDDLIFDTVEVTGSSPVVPTIFSSTYSP
jgi:hypothetical protein